MIGDLKPLDGLLQRTTIFLLKPTFMALKNELPMKHLMKKIQLNNAVASSTSTTLLQIFCMSSFSKPSNLGPSPLCQQENSLQCLNSVPCRQSYQRTKPCSQVEKCILSIPPYYHRVNTDCSNLPRTPYLASCPCLHSESPKQSPSKICYRKCLPLFKLLRLSKYHKISASPPLPLPKHPKKLKRLTQCVPFSSPPMSKCPKFLKFLLQKEYPSSSPSEPCPRSLSCSCFSSLCPLCRSSTCSKPLTYPPPLPLQSCSTCPECSPPLPYPSPLPCCVYLYSELPPLCSCSKTCPRSQNIKVKYSKDVPSNTKFLSDTGRNEVQRMSSYRIKLRPTQAQMLRSRGLHSSCILLKSDSEKDCKSVSDICKLKKETCSKPCKDREAECYPEKVKCEIQKPTEPIKEEKIVCPKSCVRGGKCIITQVKKPDKMVYGPTDCPPPKLVSPPVCPPTVDSEIEEAICHEKRAKSKKEVCTPPPLPGPPTEPISLCPCPPPPKLHPGPCPCPARKNDMRVKPGRPCPVKDKYPCCLPTYYCPIKSTTCVRKPPCEKKKKS
ncbi:hypothetical protein V1478_012694 [Vespula squamosa]|uniref:Uncharacterized protein n=1 Tax=Vespula squamosa TaxID=30214 RepID=A0ABD2A8R7_VESSQ